MLSFVYGIHDDVHCTASLSVSPKSVPGGDAALLRNNRMTTFDVAIVGAGPAGSSLAIRLAAIGQNVLLLEKKSFPRDKVCGDIVSAKGLMLLDELGCFEAIARRKLLPLRRARTALNGKWLAKGGIPPRANTIDYYHAVPRVVLDEIIFRRAQEAGATTVENCTVRDLEIDSDSATLTALESGTQRQYSARLVVGADGAHSVVARRAGLAMTDERFVEFAMRAYCHGLPLRESMLWFEEDFFPGFGWVYPISDGLANIGVGMVAESVKRFDLKLHDFFGRLSKRLQNWAAEQGWRCEIEKPVGWPIKTYGGARTNYFERGLLVGEAGCFVDPLSGEGIAPALENATLARETISDAFDRGDFSRRTLRAYEGRWRQKFDPDFGVADLLVSFARNRHLLRVWMDALKVVCKTADKDPNYAWRVGGVLAVWSRSVRASLQMSW